MRTSFKSFDCNGNNATLRHIIEQEARSSKQNAYLRRHPIYWPYTTCMDMDKPMSGDRWVLHLSRNSAEALRFFWHGANGVLAQRTRISCWHGGQHLFTCPPATYLGSDTEYGGHSCIHQTYRVLRTQSWHGFRACSLPFSHFVHVDFVRDTAWRVRVGMSCTRRAWATRDDST